LDHVTLVVRDLEAARGAVRNLGFRVKEGRLHPNGIRNAHVKTRSGASLELLTVDSTIGQPDHQSREYLDFLAAGEGGAFIALGGAPVDSVAARLEPLALDYTIERGLAWDYLTFPPDSDLRHLYFIDMHTTPNDPDSVVVHMNGAIDISAVALDGAPRLASILGAVGAVRCGEDSGGVRMRLGTSDLALRQSPGPGRPRVRGIQVRAFTLGRAPTDVHGLSIGWSVPQ